MQDYDVATLSRIIIPVIELEEDLVATGIICLDLQEKRVLYFGPNHDDEQLGDYRWVSIPLRRVGGFH